MKKLNTQRVLQINLFLSWKRSFIGTNLGSSMYIALHFTANLTPFQIPNLFHFHKSVATKLLTFPIWSSSLHQVLYPWILCFCLKKKLVSEYQDISRGEVSIFSVKAQLPAAAHPWHEDMHIIAKKNPDQFLLHHSRNQDTSISGEGLQTVPFKS